MPKPNQLTQKIQEDLASRILDIVEKVIDQRTEFYVENPDKIPDENDAKSIISRYSNQNFLVSGASGIAALAGPAGLLAVIPEIAALIYNQTRMVYDLGMAHGKQDFLTRELIVGVLTSAAVTGGIGMLTVQGSKVLVQKTSTNILMKVVQMFSAKTAQSASKSILGRYVPAVGAAAIAGWSKYSTRRIGKRAVEIFTKDIEYVGDPDKTTSAVTAPATQNVSGSTDIRSSNAENFVFTDKSSFEDDTSDTLFEVEDISYEHLDEIKIQALINLMLADGESHPDEQEFIRDLIEVSDLNYAAKTELLGAIERSTQFKINYSQLAGAPDDALSLLMDLTALSKYDGELHISEKIYIKQVGKAMNLSDTDVEELLLSM